MGFGGDAADGFAALANHFADFIGVDAHGVQARRVLRQLLRPCHRGLHLAQNMQTRFFGLRQRNLHDFFGNALNFNIHLQSGNAFGGACYFEIHVAQMVFVAQNIG